MRYHNLNNLCAAGRLLALSAVVLFFSCNRMEHPDAGGETRGSLSVVSDAFSTKGAEFSATELSPDARLYITATLRDSKDRISTPSVFLSGSNPAFAQLKQESGTTWVVKDENFILPLGGYALRSLAFGADRDNGDIPTGFGTSCWVPTLNAADAASGMRFDNVDTYANQVDLLYGATGDITGSSPTGTLVLQHALAQLIFNVKFTGSGTAFIMNNAGSTPKFKIDDILFVNNAGLVQYLKGQTVTEANILLGTKGTFTVDNTKTVLSGRWSSPLLKQDDKYKVNMTLDAGQQRSKSNLAAVRTTPVFGDAASWNVNNIGQDELYQLGNPLLVPEQPVSDFIVVYTYDGVRYSSIVPLPEGSWKSGQKYIYNLEITRAGGILTFRAAGQGIGAEYDSDKVDKDWL